MIPNMSTFQDKRWTYVLAKDLSKQTREELLSLGWKYDSHVKTDNTYVNNKRCFKIYTKDIGVKKRYLPLPDINPPGPSATIPSSSSSMSSVDSPSFSSNSEYSNDFGFEFDNDDPFFGNSFDSSFDSFN